MDELQHFREKFKARLKERTASAQKFAVPILMVFVAGFGAVFSSFLLFQPAVTWLFLAGLGLVAAGLYLMAITATVFQRKLECPACHNLLVDGIDEYCPECGEGPLEQGNWRGARRCPSCGKKLVNGRNRNFKYRACTHCGVFLAERGV